jgi:hypothetical protein
LATARLQHGACLVFQAEKHARQVDCDDILPGPQRRLIYREQFRSNNARVVESAVETAIGPHCSVDQMLYEWLGGHVPVDELCGPTDGPNRPHGVFGAGRVPVRQRQSGAFLGELHSGGAADAARRARDYD